MDSILKNQETYTFGNLTPILVAPEGIIKDARKAIGGKYKYIECVNSTGDTDFCTQVNVAAGKVQTKHFSILEFDDTYTAKWFKMAHDYFYTNESVSLFLPIGIIWSESAPGQYQYVNEIAWTGSFSNELGYLDYDCLQDYPSFNLTGGIFNTEDFNAIGGFKPSIKVAFNYELLLRMAKKEMKIFVVPKEGYLHLIGRKGSLTDEYAASMDKNDIKKWFDLAKAECIFKEDRKTTISGIKEEVVV